MSTPQASNSGIDVYKQLRSYRIDAVFGHCLAICTKIMLIQNLREGKIEDEERTRTTMSKENWCLRKRDKARYSFLCPNLSYYLLFRSFGANDLSGHMHMDIE